MVGTRLIQTLEISAEENNTTDPLVELFFSYQQDFNPAHLQLTINHRLQRSSFDRGIF
jgi:hypothetical protein